MFSEAFQMREMVDRCAVHDERNLRQSTKVCSSMNADSLELLLWTDPCWLAMASESKVPR